MVVGDPLYCTGLYGCNGGRNVDLRNLTQLSPTLTSFKGRYDKCLTLFVRRMLGRLGG